MQYVNFDAKGSNIKFVNLRDLGEFGFDVEDIDDEADIDAIFEELDAYAQSSELDLSYDSINYRTINPEYINSITIEDEDNKESVLTLDDFKLKNIEIDNLDDFLESANIGDVVYLRVESGDCNYRVELSEEGELEIGYVDCSIKLNSFDLLAKDYYDRVCDSLLPDFIPNSTIEEYKFEPNIIYAKLYRVVFDEVANSKVLEKIEIPGYYFLDESSIEEE